MFLQETKADVIFLQWGGSWSFICTDLFIRHWSHHWRKSHWRKSVTGKSQHQLITFTAVHAFTSRESFHVMRVRTVNQRPIIIWVQTCHLYWTEGAGTGRGLMGSRWESRLSVGAEVTVSVIDLSLCWPATESAGRSRFHSNLIS